MAFGAPMPSRHGPSKHSKHHDASSQLGRSLATLLAHTLLFIPPLSALLQLLLVLLLGVAKLSGLEETLNKFEVGVWSDFACLVTFLEIAEFCSKSAKTQRWYPLRFGH